MSSPRQTKGFFGRIGLPVSRSYLHPASRNGLLIVGAGLAAITTAILLVNIFAQQGGLISNGPLSSAHASLEDNCASCHAPADQVTDTKCAFCHENATVGLRLARASEDAVFGRAGRAGLGVHTFDAHYVYVSDDPTRAFVRGNEMACVACHTEHLGRTASLTDVSTDRCTVCHTFSFASHPEFSFVAAAASEDAGLQFTHTRHVGEVMRRDGIAEAEVACLSCHKSTAEGRLFEPINYQRHCSSCHLGSAVRLTDIPIRRATDVATVRGGRVTLALGVEPLDAIRRRQGPGEAWAQAMSPASFDEGGGYVTKLRIEHADPWILHNLAQLRRALYPDAGLSSLLRASPQVRSGGDRRELYEEALATLRLQADGLRGRPDPVVAQELAGIDREIAELEREIASPDAVLSDSRFRSDVLRAELSPEQIDQIGAFAREVAEPCLKCHQVQRAVIARVQRDQRVMTRATFNHRAHVFQRNCLSCHAAIPIAENLGVQGMLDLAIDGAAIQNLPRIAECQACHNPQRASDRCTTCHVFHPDRGQLTRLMGQ